MKIKEVEVTANVAWSPKEQYPILLAAGTAAQQLDASFDTTSSLDVFSLNLNEGGLEMPKVASLPVESRFHSLVWGSFANNGVIVGGLDRGLIQVYDASKLLKNAENPLTFSKDKHSGPVNSLDLNPFQSNLLASGASESEIFIWDLNKPAVPMTPGTKSQPFEEVRGLAWNRQVQHILASTFPSKCVVWDLRKNEPIIKVSDSTSGVRMRCKSVAWHPEVATQLCLASEDDHSPVIQIWDLRLASSPLKTLEGHSKGVLSVAWCQQDSDLLMSCGKDNKVLCWNPNSNNEEILCELAYSSQWSFNVAWCPRNPALIAASSFDSRVSIHSLMGGQEQEEPTTSSIADSFPGMENMTPVAPTSKPRVQAVHLKQPPKWLRRPCGANFGFGGKLVTFEASPKQPNEPQKSLVRLGSVVTEQKLVQRSMRLETSIQSGNMHEFCEMKVNDCSEGDEEVWQFIKANFDADPRIAFLSLLKYEPETTKRKISEQTGTKPANAHLHEQDFQVSDRIDAITDDFGGLNASDDTFEAIAAQSEATAKLNKPFDICTDDSGSGYLSKALLTGNIELAVELCLEQNRMADAIILAMQGGESLLKHAQAKYFEKSGSKEIPLIRAVVSGDWDHLVSCIDIQKNWKEALVAALTYADQDHVDALCSKLGIRLCGEANMKHEALICFICARNLDQVVSCWMDTRKEDQGPEALQDLVEVVMTLKSAAERLSGGQAVEISTGPLSAQLTKYASILCAQGALTAALSYLGQSTEESIAQLRERLHGALGSQLQQQQPQPQHTNLIRTTSNNQQCQRTSWNSGGTGIHNPAMEDIFQPPPVPHFDQGGITQRRGSRPPVDSYDPYASARRTSTERMPQAFPTQPQQPVNIFTPDYSTSYGMTSGVAPPSMSSQAPPPSSVYDQYAPPVSSGPGWNDPPPAALSLARTKAAAKTSTVSAITSPITQPLTMDPSYEQQFNQPPTMNYNYQQPQQPSYMEPQPPANLMHHNSFGQYQQEQTYAPPPPVQQPPQVQQPPTPEPPQPIQKGPIPAEHQVLKDVFDGLKDRCLSAANHPQIKRKLADVAKKLDVLYDKLRDNALPATTTAGLHQMVQYIWAYDYNSCIQVINQMVSGGSFALLAEFLPGVKVLIQVAGQLGVYIEKHH